MPELSYYEEEGVKYYYTLRGVSGTPRSSIWYNCAACGLPFPEKDMRRLQGKFYGIPCGCASYASSRR